MAAGWKTGHICFSRARLQAALRACHGEGKAAALRELAAKQGWPVLRVVGSGRRKRPSLRRLVGYD